MRELNKRIKIKTLQKTAIVILVAVFVLLLLDASIFPRIILNKLNKTNLLSYSVDVDEVKVNLFKKQLLLKSVLLNDTLNNNNISVSEINVVGIKYLQLLFSTIYMDSVVFDNPEGKISIDKEFEKPKKINTAPNRKFDMSIGKIVVNNACSEIENNNDLTKFSGVDVEVFNVSTSKNNQHSFQNFSFDKMLVSVGNCTIPFADSLYTFQGKKINFNSLDEEVSIENLKLISNSSKYEIARIRGVETDWFDFTIKNIKTSGFDLNNLLKNQSFIADYISFEQLDGTIFRDKRPPFPKKPNTKLPMEMIDSLPFALHVDSLAINNANIKYEEHVKGANKPGFVFFTHLQAKLFQISNSPDLIQMPTKMLVNTRFMGKPLLDVDFEMPNKKYPGSYRAKGTLEPTGFRIFNPMLTESLSATLKSGQIEKFEFNFKYNNETSNGILTMEYSDLKIDAQKQDSDSKNHLKLLVLNNIIIRKNNIANQKSYKQGEISFDRNKKKSIFNFWLKSLFSGIESVIIKY